MNSWWISSGYSASLENFESALRIDGISPPTENAFPRKTISRSESILERLVRDVDTSTFSTSDASANTTDIKKGGKCMKEWMTPYGWFVPLDT